MEIVYIDKNFKKTKTEEMRVIQKGVNKLVAKITQYEKTGTSFEHIYNDDTVKYSILENDFCIFKHQNQQMPLRLLYRFKHADSANEDRLEIHLSYIKKYDDNRYFTIFRNYAACN
ncbi:MAG: hypothetical protein ACI4JE_00455 [Ruminococcus sp.]